MKTFAFMAVLILSGCASSFDKQSALLDACCISPIPENAKDQKFAFGAVAMRSITFCKTR
jgi:hypothetical protein